MMKPRSIKTLACGGALAISLAACGGGAELVVPLFVFGFAGTSGGASVTVFFGPDDPTTASGSFTFVNFTFGGNFNNYVGAWSNCGFTMSVAQGQTAQAPAAASYSGQFQGMETIVLTPTSGTGLPTLTLRRSGTATRSFAC